MGYSIYEKYYLCRMFQIGKTIVSDELIEKDFVCNLNACKGACCVEGDAGAPVEKEEVQILEDIYEKVKPFLRPEGIAVIESEGTSVVSEWGELETPLINGRDCAYVTFTDTGIASCGIENAYNAGVIDFKKPISCHLYPARIKEYSSFSSVNYHKWDVCDPACTLGASLQVPVYKFLKEALVRKFGEAWYAELEKVAADHK